MVFFFLAGRKRGSMLFYYFSCDYFLFMPRGHQFSSFIIGKKKKKMARGIQLQKNKARPSPCVCVGPVSAHWEKERGEWRGGRIQSTRRGTWVLNWYDMMQLLSLFFYHLSTHMHFPFFFFLSPGQLVVVALYPTNTTSKEKIERHSGQKKKERERWNWIEFSCRPRAYTVHHCVSFKYNNILFFFQKEIDWFGSK